ncbi:6572_t:CDS:2 [Cetraspora pellucida]|uniref:6572_t:CDS:1 n=1 Tax=Cetraspora pellucida TaxID=1433469 RepID=A0ACA9M2G2_9GLOM|nr:6572_t:CDS:2 [Cetraspora pellucida]
MGYSDSETEFLNPNKNNRSFESLDRNTKLNEEMKTFKHTRHISVTLNEEQLQLAESSLKKEKIIFTIETLIGSLNEANRPQFKELKSKQKDELLIILQQVRDLYNATNADEIEETI